MSRLRSGSGAASIVVVGGSSYDRRVLLLSTCPGCGRTGPAPCSACRRALHPIGAVEHPPDGVGACVALFAYEGTGRALVTGLKYRNQRSTVGWLGRALAAQLREATGPLGAGAVVTWVPTSPPRRRGGASTRRPSSLGPPHARSISQHVGCSGVSTPHPRPGAAGASGSPGRASRFVPGRVRVPVVLVDDVLTTGATIHAAATALGDAGAPVVTAAVVALTPDSAEAHAQVGPGRGRRSGSLRATKELAGRVPGPCSRRDGIQEKPEVGGRATHEPPSGEELEGGSRRPAPVDRVPGRRRSIGATAGIVELLSGAPAVRLERMAHARMRLAAGLQPTDDALASR